MNCFTSPVKKPRAEEKLRRLYFNKGKNYKSFLINSDVQNSSSDAKNSDTESLRANWTGCTASLLRRALKKFQRKHRLVATGLIDTNTLALMKATRCGNSDNYYELTMKAIFRRRNNSDKTDIFRIISDIAHVGTRHLNTKGEKIGNDYFSQFTNLNIEEFSASAPPKVRRLKNRTFKYYRALNDRRQEQFLDDGAKFRNKIDKFISNEESMNESYFMPGFRSRVKRGTLLQLVGKNATDVIVNGIYTNFRRGNGEKITWRLLESGLSSKISINDQRHTMALAFRVWSEVIPLVFSERLTGHVDNVDIEIGFGKCTYGFFS